MKMKEKECSIALALTFIILFLIFVSSTASALQTETDPPNFTVPEITGGAGDSSDDKVVLNELSTEENNVTTESIQAAALKITEKRIITSAAEQYSPAIYGNKIAWEDTRNGEANAYMYNLSTKKETQIPIDAERTWYPAIYGDKIACMGYRGEYNYENYEDCDIYTYDISTNKEKRIIDDSLVYSAPAIYGDRIVWADYRRDGLFEMNDIYMYNLSTSKETRITNSGSTNCPDIYGNKIVWLDCRNGYSDVYMYDISTKKETQITNNESSKRFPAIYGDRIVWVDSRNDDGNYDIFDIYMYNLSTRRETQITTTGSVGEGLDIYGDRIVWTDSRNGNWDIYVYDLATGQECHTTDKSDQYEPEIYGDRIVWTDMRNGNADIYMGILSKSSPVAAFSAAPTTGKAPLKVKFTDTSTGSPTSWKWDFGDGSKSYLQNPTHKYSKAGTYTVNLTVKNAAGSNTVTKTDYIVVVSKPTAAFSAEPTEGKAPLTVAFTDQSLGNPTKWKWSFGDGTISREQNPEHQYSQEGKYKIILTVSNAAGSSTVTKTNYIKVTTNTRPGIYSESKINP
ncbi:hypothetical protein A9239_01945 [Methanosarcina sp. A14]|uniref:Cell surface protein n=2 Tax=Methanosarcina TaxID=2207 RepID=A0A0E3LMN2_METBA|nr:cell surface protein [Methanosarcina barkeri MS]OEC95775.1 hypothetical protein A9239_01945 [Methanosarcina sp. A14]